MNKLTIEEEILITNMVTNELSSDEELKFNHLINTSAMAKEMYEEQLRVHNSLVNGADCLPEIDISEKVMTKINTHQKRKIMSGISTNQFLRYAAVLILGCFIGGAVSYMAGTNSDINVNQLAGTLVKTDSKIVEYTKDGVSIKVDRLENETFRVMTIAVNANATDVVQCIIDNADKSLTEDDIDLTYTRNVYVTSDLHSNDFELSCIGSNVFIIKQPVSTPVNIRFQNKTGVLFTVNE